MAGNKASNNIQVHGPWVSGKDAILSPGALTLVETLAGEFGPRVEEILDLRRQAQARYDAGETPDFLAETSSIRAADWRVAALPADLQRRIVEITGPVERKMIINALNSGADVFMADFEDACSPTWQNMIAGQVNLRDAVRGTIEYVNPDTGKQYSLGQRVATLMVRPRGWHLHEKHVTVGNTAVPAALFDAGLYLFHNARALLARGTGPYFYLPKLQSHIEARLWNDVFKRAEAALDIPAGTIKATVLIETLPAAFEMDEILYELRDRAAGLNCGRWDYIFSYIKTFRNRADMVIPDRDQVGMTQPFMRAYSQLLIKTCHRRGALAMGGMAAQIPIKDNVQASEVALAKVRADKEREARDGHDGTWVAHPGLVPVARNAFEAVMRDSNNQLDKLRQDVHVSAADLIAVPAGTRTDAGLRHNIRVGIQYLEAWLGGTGCVPLYNLMEDAATAEICRTQIWQWLRHGAITADGAVIDKERVDRAVDEELDAIRTEMGAERFERGAFVQARRLFTSLATNTSEFIEFLTLPAYDLLVRHTSDA